MQQLYEDEIASHSNSSSRMLSMEEELESHRSKRGVLPRGTIAIPLPTAVEMDASTWVKLVKVGIDGEILLKSKFRVNQKT